MSIEARLTKLETAKSVRHAEGMPIRPLDMTDADYEQACSDKRKELGLKSHEQLNILALIVRTEKNPDGTMSISL